MTILSLWLQEVQSNIQLVNTYKEIVKSPRILDEVSKDLNDKYSPSKLSSMLTITNEENTQTYQHPS